MKYMTHPETVLRSLIEETWDLVWQSGGPEETSRDITKLTRKNGNTSSLAEAKLSGREG